MRCKLVAGEERLTRMSKSYIALTWEVVGQPEFGGVYDNIVHGYGVYGYGYGIERLEELARAIGRPVLRTIDETMGDWLADGDPVLINLNTESFERYGERWVVRGYLKVPA